MIPARNPREGVVQYIKKERYLNIMRPDTTCQIVRMQV